MLTLKSVSMRVGVDVRHILCQAVVDVVSAIIRPEIIPTEIAKKLIQNTDQLLDRSDIRRVFRETLLLIAEAGFTHLFF